ncbi:acyl-CoA carboxylase epsilon subunit [Streptomyces sp. NPDC091272]|uniref:acyl-CoA carboxylase epsilon subunit n=1 Tax=Streptomyces sp. NPDC091272 TaxID=3365981 RepID=UPI0038068616
MTTVPAAAPAPAAPPPPPSGPPSQVASVRRPLSVSPPLSAPPTTPPPTPDPAPLTRPWQITGGRPTDEETAVLAAVLTALLAHHAASRQAPAHPAHTDTVWDRVHHNPHVRTGSWRSR